MACYAEATIIVLTAFFRNKSKNIAGNLYLLTRSILYTAITRAAKLLIIVGREETIRAMVENAKTGRRYSGLKLRLQGKAPEYA